MSVKAILYVALSVFSGHCLAGSPYDNLAFALKQQQIINDLRQHCNIDKSVPDEKIRTVFLNSKPNQESIMLAAQAYDKKDQQRYASSIESIRCPGLK
ncbi:hypothetical protein COO59_06375 [Mixta theicola]|uniref:Uncharacterized protein YicS n=1 Tax=Mixta theicola TaxID=1458355 RepID=A0A2K1QCI1_9GAMM|nr:YicS family protein [Mixta theicola]PNS12731.1 hypothetical protein COO59_06375 [Mixta theicola]GLR10315.1 hypothetical protein GCM10007905_30350 [Mixta theicola]